MRKKPMDPLARFRAAGQRGLEAVRRGLEGLTAAFSRRSVGALLAGLMLGLGFGYGLATVPIPPAEETVVGGEEQESALGTEAEEDDPQTATEPETIETGAGPLRLVQPVTGEATLLQGHDWYWDEGAEMWLFHPGVLLEYEAGAPVAAPLAGTVTDVIFEPDFTRVRLDHGNGVLTEIGLHAVEVLPGDDVTTGQRLGELGTDGQLYLEVRSGDEPLDPVPLLRPDVETPGDEE